MIVASRGEESDGLTSLQHVATFDMTDVGKQDMHVSFKGNKIIVAWRRVKITEKREDDALVRERLEKKYSQIIPLPDGTSVRLAQTC